MFHHGGVLLLKQDGVFHILVLITPHAQRERGKVIGLGVLVYTCIYIYSPLPGQLGPLL